jgi:N6-adenosine-specific RNA methylase IME4
MTYNIIYADPPWKYKCWSGKGKEKKSAENHYPTMNIQDIYDMPVNNIAADDSILFMWVTYPLLKEGLKTIEAWGFTYKTCAFSWVKMNKIKDTPFVGLGYWTRANNEICLLATKGKPKRVSKSVQQVVLEKIDKHSKKPDCIRERIVELCGDLPRIELFARTVPEGWDVYGNEVQSNVEL